MVPPDQGKSLDDLEQEKEDQWRRIKKNGLAIIILLAGLAVILVAARWLSTNMWGNVLQAIGIAAVVYAAVEMYYGMESNESYFENRFYRAMKKAMALDEEYLNHLGKEELAIVLSSVMGIMSGKAAGHPDHGLYEIVRTGLVPVLSKPYRKDFNILITQDPVVYGGITYYLTKMVTKFTVVNPTSQAIEHEIPLWGEYPLLPGVPEEEIYQITKVEVGGINRPINSTPVIEDGQISWTHREKTWVPPGQNILVDVEDEVIFEKNDMDTFRPSCALNGLKISVFPAPGCKADIDFFGFEKVGDPGPLPRDGCFWHYRGWLLPTQGFAIRYRNIEPEERINEGQV